MKLLVIPYIIGVLFFLCVRLSSILTKRSNDLKIYMEQRLFVMSSVLLFIINTIAMLYAFTNGDETAFPRVLGIVFLLCIEGSKLLSYKDAVVGMREISYDEIHDGDYNIRPMKPFGLFQLYWFLLSAATVTALAYVCYSFMTSIVGVVAAVALYLLLDVTMCVEIVKTYNELQNRQPDDPYKYDSKGNLNSQKKGNER